MTAAWRCPVCRDALGLILDERRWACARGHSFDVAREGYVNLLIAGQRRSRQPGDSAEMIDARRRFLATGAYDPLSDAVAGAVPAQAESVLDVGCGEGRHTRRLPGSEVLGVDVAKPAVASAARAHRQGRYAVASAADVPVGDGAVDLAVNIFGPVNPTELARVVRAGGTVLAAHPGSEHLADLRALVYAAPRPHEVKPPLRDATEWFAEVDRIEVRFPVVATDPDRLEDLFAMTPYRWHAPPDIRARLHQAAAGGGFTTTADIRVTVYRRR